MTSAPHNGRLHSSPLPSTPRFPSPSSRHLPSCLPYTSKPKQEFKPSRLEIQHHQIPTTDVETRQVFYGILRIVDVFIYNKGRSSCFLRFPTIWLVPNTSIKRLHSNLTDVSIFAKYIIDFFVRNLVRKISTSSTEFSWSSLHIQNAVHFRR